MDLEEKKNKAFMDALLKALRQLAHKGPKDTLYGICMNVDLKIEPHIGSTKDVYDSINHLAVGWPQHSGELAYPIPSTNKKISEAADYYDGRVGGENKLWTRKQKVLRNSLISYMIKKIEARS